MPNNAITNESRKLSQDSPITLYQISGNASSMGNSWGNDLFLVSPEQSGGAEVQYVDRDGTLRTYIPLPINAAAPIPVAAITPPPTPPRSSP